jgi:uncharacterized membrane protein YhaH (DUF805 family)
MSLKDKLFNFDGRLRRVDWWVLSILTGLASTLFGETVALLLLGGDRSLFFGGGDAVMERMGDTTGLIISAVAAQPFLWPALALAAKRAHDRDKSARLVIALTVASYAFSLTPEGTFAAAAERLDDRGLWSAGFFMLTGVAGLMGNIYLLIVLGFLDGTPGPNRYGPSPKRLDPTPTLAQTES